MHLDIVAQDRQEVVCDDIKLVTATLDSEKTQVVEVQSVDDLALHRDLLAIEKVGVLGDEVQRRSAGGHAGCDAHHRGRLKGG